MFEPNVEMRVLLKHLAATAAIIVLGTAVYFVLPLGLFGGPTGTWSFVAVFAVGLGVVSGVIVRQVQQYRGGYSLVGVAASLYLAVLFFAAVYYGIAVHIPTAIDSLQTKIDALYFSLAITTTVGFGDVHAVSQLARAVAAVHMAFNIGFLGVAVSVVRASTRRPRS